MACAVNEFHLLLNRYERYFVICENSSDIGCSLNVELNILKWLHYCV